MAQTELIKGRLKRVRKRKAARKGFACDTIRVKMKLVRRRNGKK
jgi:hypothetical protein